MARDGGLECGSCVFGFLTRIKGGGFWCRKVSVFSKLIIGWLFEKCFVFSRPYAYLKREVSAYVHIYVSLRTTNLRGEKKLTCILLSVFFSFRVAIRVWSFSWPDSLFVGLNIVKVFVGTCIVCVKSWYVFEYIFFFRSHVIVSSILNLCVLGVLASK